LKEKYKQIYLDYNATTPCSKEVVDAMLPYFSTDFGNASSSHHAFGWMAKDAIDEATQTIASIFGVSTKELIYTSGATESINSILRTVCTNITSSKNEILTSKTEHKAVLDVCKYLEGEGAKIKYLELTSDGLIDLEKFKDTISQKTLITAIIHANNETGTIQPLENIAELCKANGSLLFSDATQTLGKMQLNDFFNLVDFACFSAHKVYGPKGIGLTYCKEQFLKELKPLIIGGGQQSSLRGGTYNTPSIVGFSKAIELANFHLNEEVKRLTDLRNTLEAGLSKIEETTVNGKNVARLPNTLNISFKYVDGEILLRALSKNIAVSNGSACNSATTKPSHVLTAMGIANSLAFSSIRFSLGRFTTLDNIEQTIKIVTDEVQKLRASNVLWASRNK